MSDLTRITQKLQRQNQLEQQYSLARQGLAKGVVLTVIILFIAVLIVGAGLYAFVVRGPGFLSGNQVVLIFFILAGILIAYFSFVFNRNATLKAGMDETKSQIEIGTSNSVIGDSEKK